MTTTANPSDKSTFIVLTNGNLTIASTSTTDVGLCRTVNPVGTGLKYFEFTLNTTSGTESCSVGPIGSAETTADWLGQHNGIGFFPDTGKLWQNGAALTTLTGLSGAAGQLYGVTFDMTHSTWYVRKGTAGNWNGSGTANPVTNTGGQSFSSVTVGSGIFVGMSPTTTTDKITMAFAAASWAGTPPAGATEINPAVASIVGQRLKVYLRR